MKDTPSDASVFTTFYIAFAALLDTPWTKSKTPAAKQLLEDMKKIPKFKEIWDVCTEVTKECEERREKMIKPIGEE